MKASMTMKATMKATMTMASMTMKATTTNYITKNDDDELHKKC